MAEFMELSLDELEQVTGGHSKAVNTGDSRNAAIRNAPGDGNIITSLTNGTWVEIVGSPVYDVGTDRNWIKVKFKMKGKIVTGWIAASIVGMKRK